MRRPLFERVIIVVAATALVLAMTVISLSQQPPPAQAGERRSRRRWRGAVAAAVAARGEEPEPRQSRLHACPTALLISDAPRGRRRNVEPPVHPEYGLCASIRHRRRWDWRRWSRWRWTRPVGAQLAEVAAPRSAAPAEPHLPLVPTAAARRLPTPVVEVVVAAQRGRGGAASEPWIPFLPWSAAVYNYHSKNESKYDPEGYCLPPGGPRLYATPYPMVVLQQPELKRIYMNFEGGTHVWREIFMDGRDLILQKTSSRAQPGSGIPSDAGRATRSLSMSRTSTKGPGSTTSVILIPISCT